MSEAYLLNFPASGDDLPFGHYWAKLTVHELADDFDGTTYDKETNSWPIKTSGQPHPNENYIIFGTPIYAAADGEIIAGWREYPDKYDPDDENEPNSYKFNTHRMTVGGNHLTIRTNDGHYVYYAHMKSMSIPEKLCPVGSNDGWLKNDPLLINENWIGGENGFPKEYLIPVAKRQRVHKGQFLGRVGNSGQSKRPHLHLQVAELSDNAGILTRGEKKPVTFVGGLYQNISNVNNVDWQALDGQDLDERVQEGKLAIAPNSPPRPSLSSRTTNRLDIFARGQNGQLRFKFWDGVVWSEWNNLGGILTSSPTSVSWSSDRIDCFARGRNLHLWHKFWTSSGGWSDWTDHGGILTSDPSVVSTAPNRLNVFARGRNNNLWQISWNGSRWSDWEDLGGQLHSAPSCVSWSPNRIDCVVRGRNLHLWHKYWNGDQWSDWTDLGGVITSAPSISSRATNRLDVFARGQNHHLWLKQWDGNSWGEWVDLGGVLTSAPSSVSWNSDRIDIQARGQNGNLWHKYWSPSGWSEWTDMGDF